MYDNRHGSRDVCTDNKQIRSHHNYNTGTLTIIHYQRRTTHALHAISLQVNRVRH